MKWLSYHWWKYLLAKPSDDTTRRTAFICRIKGHPEGVLWYNPSGYEPDMRCRNCGDDLG